MIYNFKKFNENLENIDYVVTNNDNEVIITAYLNSESVAYICFVILYDPYGYDFTEDFTEDEFYEIFSDDELVNISTISVEPKYRRKGIAFDMLNYGINHMTERDYKQFYLNASPMGSRGANITNLVRLYKKVGFEEILDQGNNVLMKLVL